MSQTKSCATNIVNHFTSIPLSRSKVSPGIHSNGHEHVGNRSSSINSKVSNDHLDKDVHHS